MPPDGSAFAGFVTLTPHEAATLCAVFEAMWPQSQGLPGIGEAGLIAFVDRALDGPDRALRDLYRLAVPRLDDAARSAGAPCFRETSESARAGILASLQAGTLPDFILPPQREVFAALRRHLIEGLFSDPAHGGNREAMVWRAIGYPGVRMDNTDPGEPALAPDRPIPTLAVHERESADPGEGWPAGFDPQDGAREPLAGIDVVVVGAGGVGGLVASWLALKGARVVALEAGAWRPLAAYKPDELSYANYGRAGFGEKFNLEDPRWREREDGPSVTMPYSLGRMCNGVGGSLIHYGARLRRQFPHHFRMRSTLAELGLFGRLDEDCTVADWPFGHEELEPYYERLEGTIGVAGEDTHPFIPRRTSLPMPPTRPFPAGELFAAAARARGFHPMPIPVGQNTVPFGGRPAMTYSPWAEGLGSATADRWTPMHDLLPAALASGNLRLRTQCRVLRVLTGPDGHASGAVYADPDGLVREQKAPVVILAAYTFETVRLMFLSADARHPEGLGNTRGQLGRHFMTKQFPSVYGAYRDRAFDRHKGPGAQGAIVEDLLSPAFFGREGMSGGGTLSTENQLLPIQLAREPPPPDIGTWGADWQRFILEWNSRAALRIQTDTLPYAANRIDLDPVHRDRTGFGLPIVRVTYEVRAAERRLYERMMTEAERLHAEMGADRTWRGPWFTGIGSCHDLGGCRMGEDPAGSVVGPDLEVHDTPGLFVMSGATFPSCHGVNPTLTLWACCARATDRLAERMGVRKEGLHGNQASAMPSSTGAWSGPFGSMPSDCIAPAM